MNKYTKAVALSAVLVLSLTLSLGIIQAVAEPPDDTNTPETPVLRCWSKPGTTSLLSDEQRATLDEAIQALREANATRQEIREYIVCFLEENSVEYTAPEAPNPKYSGELLDKTQQCRGDMCPNAYWAVELGLELPEDGFIIGLRHHGPVGSYGSVEPQ